jgi:porin
MIAGSSLPKLGRTAILVLAALPGAAFAETKPPVQVGFSYIGDFLSNLSGGLERDSAWLGRADATLEADGSAVGLPGATFFFDLIYTHGPDFSGRSVGDAQVVSNVQGDGVLRAYEAYVDFPLGQGFSAKAGLVDLNTEFDVQSIGAFFTNSSHGIGVDFSQSGQNGPSIFPVTSAAALVRWSDDRWTVRSGIFNAVAGHPERPRRVRVAFPGADGSLLVTEAGVQLTPRARAQIGGWAYTSPEAVIDDPDRRAKGSKGAYGQLELRLAGEEEGPRLDSWVRAGTANSRTNRVTLYTGGGITYGTDRERVGIAVARARQSLRAARHFSVEEGPQLRAETAFELGYARQVADFLTVQPVAHYVINPGWRSDVGDAFVAGVRLSFALER